MFFFRSPLRKETPCCNEGLKVKLLGLLIVSCLYTVVSMFVASRTTKGRTRERAFSCSFLRCSTCELFKVDPAFSASYSKTLGGLPLTRRKNRFSFLFFSFSPFYATLYSRGIIFAKEVWRRKKKKERKNEQLLHLVSSSFFIFCHDRVRVV